MAVTTSGVLSGVTLAQISADQGAQYTCALSAAGAAYCWGAASFGQLGNGGSSTPGVPVAVSRSGVLFGVTLAQIATGSGTTCALSAGGAGYCWGQNSNGELGNNSTTSTTVPVAMITSGLGSGKRRWPRSAWAPTSACALDSANAVYCWGLNTSGQVGNPATGTHFLVPTAVTSQSTISAGYAHSCMIRNGRAYCWGDNTYGEAGQPHHHQQQHPNGGIHLRLVLGGHPHPDHRGLLLHLCAEQRGQRVLLGPQRRGRAGQRHHQQQQQPGGGIHSRGAGRYHRHADHLRCRPERVRAVQQRSRVLLGNYNSNGQDGNNTVSNSSVPVAVSTSGVLSGVTLTQVSSGTNSTCALSSIGAAYCWGGNSNGQLGNNLTTASPVPVAVTTSGALSGATVTQVSAGNSFACAVGGTGAAYCWGYNASGQLGNASTTSSSVPVAVTTSGALSGVTVTQVSAGASYTCALGGTGAPYCWGLNGGGQLGNGSTTTSSIPVAVTTSGALSGVTVTEVSAGNTVACAVGGTGAYCWGTNGSGQAGDGTTTQRNAPVQVLLLSPGAPTGVTVTAGDTTAVVSWTAPASLGTGTLTGYTATAQPGGASCSTTTTGCTITGLTDGTTYSVTVVTRTTDGNSAPSPAVSVTPASCLTSPYSVAVAADSPTLWYPLNDTAGTTAHDNSATLHNGVYQGGVTLGTACPTTCGTAVTFNGSTGYVSNANTITSPATFSIEAWFKTTTTTGGMIAGFGNTVTGPSDELRPASLHEQRRADLLRRGLQPDRALHRGLQQRQLAPGGRYGGPGGSSALY